MGLSLICRPKGHLGLWASVRSCTVDEHLPAAKPHPTRSSPVLDNVEVLIHASRAFAADDQAEMGQGHLG